MKKALKEFHDYIIHDVVGHIPGITSRPMFGGYGIYLDKAIFAIITGTSELRFKVDDNNREQYEDLGSTPFVYEGHKTRGPMTMNYYLVPEEIIEDREKLTDWVYQSASLSKKK